MGGGETPPPQIKYCRINNSDFGISASNLSQLIIQQDTIINTSQGIVLANVTSVNIINNRIISGTPVNAGIFLESCGGFVRGNTITGHTHAIHLGNSSPDIGGNTITGNWNRGIYVGYGSLPNMIGRLYLNPPIYYAISGYNKIFENGGWLEEDDGSEIFLYNSNVRMKGGCNQVTDQRIPNTGETPPLYNTKLLMNGDGIGEQIVVYAGGNFWEEHPIYRLEERFGEDLIMYLDPILTEPCPEPDQGGGERLFIMSYGGEIIDTIYSVEKNLGTLTNTDLLYANAEEKFVTADYGEAETVYEQIVNGNDSLKTKLDAYRRLYEIGKLASKPQSYFNELYNTFSSISQTIEDSIQKKIFNQLSTLSLIGEEEYISAIGEFDQIIQQNPNTEEAVYAEIDAITTALLVEGDSTLGKGRLGKYLVKTGEDYLNKLDGILRKHFGTNQQQTEEELLPKEYTLYQNYPNPFNPVTTIKYDLPNASEVSLIIYDILGRRVKEIVNTKQQAGRYEIKFDASSLASGVYIYQLVAEDYVNAKKMVLLR
jgi:parallel beta-helix repeat protein